MKPSATQSPNRRRHSEGERRPGTDDQFVALVQAESQNLIAAATAIVGSPQHAEEIVQDCFAKAFQRWHRVSRLERPGAWVRRIVINQSISELRKSRNEQFANRRALHDRPTTTEVELVDSALWAAVASLPDEQAKAISLRYAGDLSATHVAEALELTETAVNSLLFRARQRLRRTVAELYGPAEPAIAHPSQHEESHE